MLTLGPVFDWPGSGGGSGGRCCFLGVDVDVCSWVGPSIGRAQVVGVLIISLQVCVALVTWAGAVQWRGCALDGCLG